jgi:2-polyprenyl-3-methyl-5-hydroxy-6-metoxy-1,4-benzoquinol methylase
LFTSLKNFYELIIKDRHQEVEIKTINDFKKTRISYEERVKNENQIFDAIPRDSETGNEVAINNTFVYKFLILERKLSAYKGMDYWQFIAEIVNKREFTRILSVGSGSCAVEMEIAQNCFRPYQIDCLDLNENLIKSATKVAQEKGLNLNPMVADLNEINFSEKYDLVIICAALHHFVELEQVFSRLHNSLANDGLFVTYEPVMRSGMFLFPSTRLFMGFLFLLLPARLRINNQDYPGEKRVDRYYKEYDRSGWSFECIRSGDIPDLLKQYFSTVHFGRGMTFLRRVSDSIYGRNYRDTRMGDRLLMEFLCWVDRFMRVTRLLRPEGLFFIGARKDARISSIQSLGDSTKQTKKIIIESWGPTSSTVGVVPNVQPNGFMGLCIVPKKFKKLRNIEVLFSGEPADTTFIGDKFIAAGISPERFSEAGSYHVSIRQTSTGATYPVGLFRVSNSGAHSND